MNPFYTFRVLAVSLLVPMIAWSAVPTQGVTWVPFRNDTLGFVIKVPADWTPRSSGRAAAFTGPGEPADRGAIGVLKSSVQGLTIEQAADKEYAAQGRPSDWVRQPARFAGARALKIIGMNKKDPTRKMVEYYIESPDGYYLVQCLAPASEWSTYSPLFAQIIKSFQFL